MTRHLAGLLAALLIACTSSGAPPEPATPTNERAPAEPATAPAPADPTAPIDAPRRPLHPSPYAVDPAGHGAPCEDDAGCGWDDGCVPTRCVDAAHAATQPTECDESAPPPGACLCHAGRCTLQPKATPAPANLAARPGNAASTRRPAAASSARCSTPTAAPARRAPGCFCDAASDRCEFRWLEAIPCDDVGACWISDESPRHPIARPKKLRGRRFQPCRDGELAPACRDGRCVVVAYKC
ncbi:MAG: hypothetical protein H6710_21885 [Myxococcales bacterium]|nr:hypothetical protein [Myxococcales bacterium]